MKTAFLLVTLILVSTNLYSSSPTLTDQLNLMRAVQDQNEAEERNAQAEQQAAHASHQRRMEQKRAAEKAMAAQKEAAALAEKSADKKTGSNL